MTSDHLLWYRDMAFFGRLATPGEILFIGGWGQEAARSKDEENLNSNYSQGLTGSNYDAMQDESILSSCFVGVGPSQNSNGCRIAWHIVAAQVRNCPAIGVGKHRSIA